MLELLSGYSLSQILIFITIFILAVKGLWEIVDFFKEKYQEKFKEDYDSEKNKEKINEKFDTLFENHKEVLGHIEKFNNKLNDIQSAIDKTNDRIDNLTESDMYDIKYSIVQAYHFFVETQGWIDDYSLSVLISRYEIYSNEGGNSFIKDLMKEIRNLPKCPPPSES